jgi:glycosyltransferase involved in cell wall biosynthesis
MDSQRPQSAVFGMAGQYVGRLSVEKGVTYLIDALAMLRVKQAEVHLLIVGEGEQRANLQAQVESLGLRQAVKFLGERGDAQQIIGALDLCWCCRP